MIVSLVLAASIAAAQETRALSIEDALRIAQDTSEALDVADAGVTRATGSAFMARSGFMPQIGASATWQHQFASEYDDLFPEGGLIDLPFGKPDSWRVDLTAQQLAFAGGRVWAQSRIAQAGLSASRLGVESERASVALRAAEAYYDAVLAERLLEIAVDTLAQAETTLEHAKLGVEVGRTAEFDVVLAGAEVESQRVSKLRAERIRDTARLRLAQMLDIPSAEGLELTSSLDADIAAYAAEVAGVGAAGEPTDRVIYKISEERLQMAKSGVAVAWAPWFPQVSLSGSIGWVSYPDSVLPPTDGEQWRSNIYVGMNISLPIFSGLRIYGGLLDARGSLYQARAAVEQTAESAQLDTADALADLEAAIAEYGATETSVEQAERAHEIAEVRFEEGVSTQSELVDARLLEARAHVLQAQAARDLQVARIRVALLPSLPIDLSPF